MSDFLIFNLLQENKYFWENYQNTSCMAWDNILRFLENEVMSNNF